jgi:hypothetical protein
LHRAEIRALDDISTTAPARTLLDITCDLAPREPAGALERAQIKRLLTKADIACAVSRAPRRPGTSALKTLVAEPALTRSKAERRLLTLLQAPKLPSPRFNETAEGYEVDVLWRAERVVLEADSYSFHATRRLRARSYTRRRPYPRRIRGAAHDVARAQRRVARPSSYGSRRRSRGTSTKQLFRSVVTKLADPRCG